MLMHQDRQLTFRDDWLPSQEDYNRETIRQMLPFKNLYAVNTSLFRTPQDLVIVSHEPERHFIFRLIENARWISSWIKSPDREFYSLEYEYWKGEKDRVRRPFNPDFFIRIHLYEYLIRLGINADPQALHRLRGFQDQGIEDLILVVEIKDDDDNSAETRAKENYGKDHFQSLNNRLRETNPIDLPKDFRDSLKQHYFFYLLRPNEYAGWFAKIQNGLIAWE
jgi:type III restriction enzyme